MSKTLPNIYIVHVFFSDGFKNNPVWDATVVAESATQAQQFLADVDPDTDRCKQWLEPLTQVEQIGWATGNFETRLIALTEGEDPEEYEEGGTGFDSLT